MLKNWKIGGGNFLRKFSCAKRGYTLTEVLLAVAIVGIISALILPAAISKFNQKILDLSFEKEIKSFSAAVNNLAVSENKLNFYSTMMYSDSQPENYTDTSGEFIKKYLKVSKYCGDNNGDCFANKYYEYKNYMKTEYKPSYKGACAHLKNGTSLCLTPQVGASSISGIIDINGPKGPNVLNRDLRFFIINVNAERTAINRDTSEVFSTQDPNINIDINISDPCKESSISKECCDSRSVQKGDPCCIHYVNQENHVCYEKPEPPKTACEIDPNSLDCCKTKSIANPSDACCTYPEIKNSNSKCSRGTVYVYCKDDGPEKGAPVVYCASTQISSVYIDIRGGNLSGTFVLPSAYNSYYKDQWRVTVKNGILQTVNGAESYQTVIGRPIYSWTYCNSKGTGCVGRYGYPAAQVVGLKFYNQYYDISNLGLNFPFSCQFLVGDGYYELLKCE